MDPRDDGRALLLIVVVITSTSNQHVWHCVNCIELHTYTHTQKCVWSWQNLNKLNELCNFLVAQTAYSVRDLRSILGLGRSPGKGNGNPLLYSCLENPMDRGAWWATVYWVTKRLHNWTTKHKQWCKMLPLGETAWRAHRTSLGIFSLAVSYKFIIISK